MPTTAVAHPNIALCKYWGKRDRALNLPTNSSLSLTLSPFRTRTTVTWDVERDEVWLNGARTDDAKVLRVLDLVRPGRPPAKVESENDFPTAAGLASSSSGFAALVLAADPERPLDELAVLARRGSGSATRSLHGGWVRWDRGERADGLDSRGVPVAPAEHWDVRMVVAIVGGAPKDTSSTDGMVHTQATSPYFGAWAVAAQADVPEAEAAVLARDLERLGRVAERSSLRMHASMFAADPPVIYWRPASMLVMEGVRGLRKAGVSCWATMDAGPNVKVLCEARDADAVAAMLRQVTERVEVLEPGGPARIVA
ncbi:MAG: diphosphomevalonate decarboxylase [Myxococcota bacterium]